MSRPAYKWYESDESDTDSSDTDSTGSTGSTDSTSSTSSTQTKEGFESQNYIALATALAQPLDTSTNQNAVNPPPATTSDMPPPVLGNEITSGYPTFANLAVPPDASGATFEVTDQSVTNVIMIDSRNRDRKAYPQPTNLTIRLPRTYTNISALSIVQIKLLSAFYYFSAVKHNIGISIHEYGRTVEYQGTTIDQIITNILREGTYDINTLIAEITTQLNKTPIFYDYPGGFQDFAKKFAVTGDTSLNFNLPGDSYYDSLLNSFIPNPTMSLIISKYFNQQYASLSTYTTDNVKIAYYYPVLKEIVLDNNFNQNLLNLVLVTSAQYLLPGETVQSRIIHTFQGLFDPVILELINNNIAILDPYRIDHTFRASLINSYTISYSSQSNHVTFQSPSLNTSLLTLLNSKQAQLLAEQLNLFNITAEQLAAITTTNALLFAVINDMMSRYQKNLAVYFGISFNTFGLNYLANPSLSLPIRDGYNAIGINTDYNAFNQTTITTDILKPFRVDAKQYWNRLRDLSGTIAHMNPVLPGETGAVPLNMNTWNIELDDQDYVNQFVKPNVLDPLNPNTTPIGNLYTNKRTQFADIVMPIEPTEYTVFRFKSPVRQTIKLETLPRPTKYRYPLYNAQAYDLSNQTLFDNSYCFVENQQNVKMDVSSNDLQVADIKDIPGFSTPNTTASFGTSYQSSLQYWGSRTDTISILETRAIYEFYTPYPPSYITCNAPAYTYTMNITMAHDDPVKPFSSEMKIFLYQDRGGFMADVSGNTDEKDYNYLHVASSLTVSSPSVSLNFKAYANKHYYIIARSQGTSFATEDIRLVPSFPSSTQFTALTNSLVGFDPLANPKSDLDNYNYAQNADTAFVKLPSYDYLFPSTIYDPTMAPLTFSEALMGYDINGVSTDLTNYVGFISNVPTSNVVLNTIIRIDPANGFIFQSKNPYNVSTQTYLYPSSVNAILRPYGANVYAPTTIPYRQQTIVHWYGNTFIPPFKNQILFPPTDIANTYVLPFSGSYPMNSTLSGYTYADRLDISGNVYLSTPSLLNLGEGMVGIGFVPGQGVWDIDRFMFKSVFTTSNSAIDSNLQIRYIGIFPATLTSNQPLGNFTLDSATAVLKFNSSITYNSSDYNFGYDTVGGTTYEFVRDNSYITGSNSYMYGYSQNAYAYNFDVNAFYIAIPFSGSSNPLYYYGLVGSALPYPKYSQIRMVDSMPSPEGPMICPQNKGYFVPGNPLLGANAFFGPQSGYTVSQSQYEQSIPIGTSLMFYANSYPITTTPTAYKGWSPFTYTPSEIIADCSGYILIKDTIFRTFSYENGTSNRDFRQQYTFTLDEVFPSSSNINYLGVAANENTYAFFGLSNASPSSFLYIRTLDPTTGVIQQTYSEVSPFEFASNVTLNKLTYNNLGGYIMSVQSNADTRIFSRASQGSPVSVMVSALVADPAIKYFDIGQSAKEEYGRFWVFPYRAGSPNGISDMFSVDPNIIGPVPEGNYVATYDQQGQPTRYAKIREYTLTDAAAYPFKHPIVIRDVADDRIFMLSEQAPQNFFEVAYTIGSITPNVVQSVYEFPVAPSKYVTGAHGASWALNNNTLYGNRLDDVDGPKKISQMWQTFYPVQRIVFHQIAKNFSLLEDLSGLTYAEYPHTAIAIYDSSNNLTNDTSGKWGLESAANFNTADFVQSGYYFNAYQYAVPLNDNRATDDFYYMTVRGYSPTEKSQVILRVSAPNQYTFGYITPTDLSGEISTAKYVATTNDAMYTYYWDKRYVNSILAFDSNFVIDASGEIFGAGVIQGYAGSNISSIDGFSAFYGKVTGLYNQYTLQLTLASTIQANIATGITNFIQTDLKYIIPPYAQNRQRYADPLRFSIKWKSTLLPEYRNLIEEWGLGWNLGFVKADTPYETVQTGTSFFKILDDFINLKLNPEIDANRMDTVLQENLASTHDSTGATKAFFGKLLLATFGSYAQTLISNPIAFANPLGKLDRMTFQWVTTTGAIIDNNDCEWNAVIQISESIQIVKPAKNVVVLPGGSAPPQEGTGATGATGPASPE